MIVTKQDVVVVVVVVVLCKSWHIAVRPSPPEDLTQRVKRDISHNLLCQLSAPTPT